MTREDLIKKLSERLGITNEEAEMYIRSTFSLMKNALNEGEKVKIMGFGSFKPEDKPARNGYNPKTGEQMVIKARKVVRFKASSDLLES